MTPPLPPFPVQPPRAGLWNEISVSFTLPAGASLDIHFHADMSNGELTFGIDGWPLKVEGGVLYPPQPLPPVTLPADVDARIVVQTSVSAPAGEVWLNGSRVATTPSRPLIPAPRASLPVVNSPVPVAVIPSWLTPAEIA